MGQPHHGATRNKMFLLFTQLCSCNLVLQLQIQLHHCSIPELSVCAVFLYAVIAKAPPSRWMSSISRNASLLLPHFIVCSIELRWSRKVWTNDPGKDMQMSSTQRLEILRLLFFQIFHGWSQFPLVGQMQIVHAQLIVVSGLYLNIVTFTERLVQSHHVCQTSYTAPALLTGSRFNIEGNQNRISFKNMCRHKNSQL